MSTPSSLQSCYISINQSSLFLKVLHHQLYGQNDSSHLQDLKQNCLQVKYILLHFKISRHTIYELIAQHICMPFLHSLRICAYFVFWPQVESGVFFVFFLVETFFFCLPLSLSNSYVSDFSTLAQHLLEGLCCHCQHLTWLMWVGDTCSHSINEWLPICWYQHNSRYCRYANIHQVNYLSIWSFIRVSLGQGGSFYLQLSSLSPPCPLYLIALSQ